MNNIQSILDRINNAKALDFGTILSEAIELFKKVWLKGFLVILFVAIAAGALNMVFGLIGLAPDISIFNNGFNLDTFLNFYSQNAVYNIPQTIILNTLTILLLGAFYKICKEVMSGEHVKDDYFYFFKKEYLSKALILGVIYTLIATIAQALLLIPYIYVMVPLSYFAVFFAFNSDLKEVEIVKLSFALGNKKWLITFGSLFVCAIIGMLGVIGCFVGLFLTISIAYLPSFLIYKEIVGFEDRSEIDFIGIGDEADTFLS